MAQTKGGLTGRWQFFCFGGGEEKVGGVCALSSCSGVMTRVNGAQRDVRGHQEGGRSRISI